MFSFDFELDDFQKEALEYINSGKSVVVCAPTGAGKTCIAEFAIHNALKSGKRIFYTTPLKALSNQKFMDFSKKYGEENVGLLTGDTSINRGASIVVMTTEVFRNMLYGTHFGSITDNLKNVGYVVLDEVHYMNDEQRGTVWEESIIYCPVNIQIIALSATVANSQQLVDWINSVHSRTELVYTDFRPVPLRHYYYDSSKPNDILPLLTPDGQLNRKIKPESKGKHFSRRTPQVSPVTNIVDVLHKKNMLPAIYFTFSRRKCDEQMDKCANLCLVTKEEQARIHEIVNEYMEENPYLIKNAHLEHLYQGVAAHHAGLLPGWKVLIEKLFQAGLIKVVFATETLAAGINMPARTTVISSISKRTDSGHRILTANEFLQMSGRAGRRGMDEVGYVVVVGTAFQSPEEVADLVKSSANPLESRFMPSYSMVLNLLERFTMDEAKELILKSFGYFSSTDRLKPLIHKESELDTTIKKLESFRCFHGHSNEDFLAYKKAKESYIETRRIFKLLKKQNKHKNEATPEIIEFAKKSKEQLRHIQSYGCENCKQYKKHVKDLEVLERYRKKLKETSKQVETAKDIYWMNFVAHKKVLNKVNYIEENFPNAKGKVTASLRSENELYLSEIIHSGVLNELNAAELASVICAVTTEDLRAELYTKLPVSVNVRRALGRIKDIRRRIAIVQKEFGIEKDMYINSFYSPLIEYWINNGDWESLIGEVEAGEGDVVRSFKRTVDVLRQLTIIQGIDEKLVQAAKDAITCILREPVDLD